MHKGTGKCLTVFLLLLAKYSAQTTFSNPSYPNVITSVNSTSQTHNVNNEQYISNNITLNDNQYFVDLSQNNFKVVGVTYSYLVQARPGNKVSLYFATTIGLQAAVTIWDGQNTNAPLIDTSAAAANLSANQWIFNAPRVTSTGEYMLIHIRPGYDDGPIRYTQDFQAIVSDYENPAQCRPLVISVNVRTSSETFNFFGGNGANCQTIIRATDTTNAQLLQGLFWITKNSTGQFNLYKGLALNANRKLRTDVSSFFVFDRNTVLQWNDAVTISYRWTYAAQYRAYELKAVDGYIGSLMTPNFIPYGQKMTYPLIQSFYITPNGTTELITLNILRPIGAASIEVVAKNGANDYQTHVYTSSNISSKLSFKCDSLSLTYTCEDTGDNNGLYATFEKEYTTVNTPSSAYDCMTGLFVISAMMNQFF